MRWKEKNVLALILAFMLLFGDVLPNSVFAYEGRETEVQQTDHFDENGESKENGENKASEAATEALTDALSKSGRGTSRIAVAVEKFTLGQGYHTEPVWVEFQKGEKLSYIVSRFLGAENYRNGGTLDTYFYIRGIKDRGKTGVNIPKYITDEMARSNITLGAPKVQGWLNEGDYTDYGGWMHLVNNEMPIVSMSDYPPNDGDVLRISYSLVGYGSDLSVPDPDWEMEPLRDYFADYDAGIRAVADFNENPEKSVLLSHSGVEKAYEGLMGSLTDLTSTQAEVDNALTAFNIALGNPTGEPLTAEEIVSADKDALDLGDISSVTGDLRLPLLGKNGSNISWSSSNTGVIENDGTVTRPVKPSGDAVVELTAVITYGGVSNIKIFTVTVTAKYDEAVEQAKQTTIQYILDAVSVRFKGSGADWEVMDMAAYGMGGYMDKGTLLANAVEMFSGEWSVYNYLTDYGRAVIALTSMGIDAGRVDGGNGGKVDFIEKIANFNANEANPSLGTINGYIYALIAYDSGNYSLPAGCLWTRDKVISRILTQQLSDGGWSLTDAYADPDITAMAVSALSNYMGRPNVEAAVNKAVACLSAIQTGKGGYKSRGVENSESTAAVITALSALGIDADKDSRFVKNGLSAIDSLLSYKTSGYTFGHTNASHNDMSTEQGFRALVAYTKMMALGGAYNIYVFDGFNEPAPVTVDKSLLAAKIQETLAFTESKYTANSWSGLLSALTAAQTVYNDVGATQPEVYSATQLLITAISNLRLTSGSPATDITVRFILLGGEKHTGEPKYIYKTNPGAFDTWIPSASVTVPKGSTARDVFEQVLGQKNIEYRETQSGYIGMIKSPNSGEWIGELTNGKYSGWLYTVNGVHQSTGFRDRALKNGDVVVWHYTDDYRFEESSEKWADSNFSGTIINALLNGIIEITASPGADRMATAVLSGTKLESFIHYLETCGDEKDSKAVVNVDLPDGSDGLSLTVPGGVLNAFKGKKETSLEVSCGIAGITLDAKVMEEIANGASGKDAMLYIEIADSDIISTESKALIGSRRVYSLSILINGKPFTSLDGGIIRVFLPYAISNGEKADELTVYSIDDAGNAFKIANTLHDRDNSGYIFATNHLSLFTIGYISIPAEETPLGSFDVKISFTDVPENYWAKDYIYYLAQNGLVRGIGDNLFDPERDITRAEFVALMFNMSGDELPESGTVFDDVRAVDWYAPFVSWAYVNNITSGTSAAAFSPDSRITCQDMSVMLKSYIDLKGLELDKPNQDADISDGEQIADYAEEAVTYMRQAGIIDKGESSMFVPAGNMTRAEASVIVARFLQSVLT